MKDSMLYIPHSKTLLSTIFITLAYLILMKASFLLTFPPENISLIWLLSGFLLATLVLTSFRTWPALILSVGVGSLLLEFIVTDRPASMILFFLIANLTEAILGALVFIKFSGGKKVLETLKSLPFLLYFAFFVFPLLVLL